MKNLSKARAKEIIEHAKGKSIAVIGDVMLDRYFWGSVSRISPEAPVPVIDIESESFHLGGAANVAKNLKSLGVKPLLCGIVGNDNSGKTFINIAEESGIITKGIYLDEERPTTVKTRIIGNNQHIARLDREVRSTVNHLFLEFILNSLESNGELSGIIFEDYNKGAVTSELITEIMRFARENSVPVFVDPKKEHFFEYKNSTVFKPNRKEASQALGLPLSNHEDIIAAGKKLIEGLECSNVLLTLGAQGMMLFEANGSISSVPTKARHVADVSGAGDTAIATIASALAGKADIREAAVMANYAAGIVCEKPGIVAVEIEELLDSIANGH